MNRTKTLSLMRRTAITLALSAAFGDRVQAAGTPGTPLGPVVTPTTTGDHGVVASDAAGNYVVAWIHPAPAKYSGTILAQRYSAASAPIGPVFTVSSGLGKLLRRNDTQNQPKIAMDDEGDFAVTWTEYGPGGLVTGAVYYRRFAADGTPSADDVFLAYGNGNDVAMDRDGDSAVVWQGGSLISVPAGYGSTDLFERSLINARRFDKSGKAAGASFQVASRVSLGSTKERGLYGVIQPSVALDPAGDMAVSWVTGHSYRLNGNAVVTQSISARRFGLDNKPLGPVAQVNDPQEFSLRIGNLTPAIASDASGGFVVSWNSSSENFVTTVHARSFDSSTVPRTGIIAVTAPPADSFEIGNGVVSDAAGDFTIATAVNNGTSDSQLRVRLRSFSPNGVSRGSPVSVLGGNYASFFPSLAMDAAGNIVVTAENQPGVAAQRFTGY